MVYADYAYYTENYLLGKEAVIPTASFSFYANKASRIIDRATWNRATDTDPVKQCCCELAEQCYNEDIAKDKPQSEKVGDYSVSYSASSYEDNQKAQQAIIRRHLADTGLLYCGVT